MPTSLPHAIERIEAQRVYLRELAHAAAPEWERLQVPDEEIERLREGMARFRRIH
jgi:hypothetical protein